VINKVGRRVLSSYTHITILRRLTERLKRAERNRNRSEHRLVTRYAGENRGWLYSPELLQRRKRKQNWLLDPTQQTNGSYYVGSTNYPGGKHNRGWQQVPEMEGPIKATDQFNGQDKHAGRESELSMEGMRFGSGREMRNGLEECRKRDRRRDVCRVGLGDAELVRCCGRGRKGVGSGTEEGMCVGLG